MKRVLRCIVVGMMIVLMGMVAWIPVLQAKEACDEALVDCMTDAAHILLSGSLSTFGVFATGCAMGYSWCLKYY